MSSDAIPDAERNAAATHLPPVFYVPCGRLTSEGRQFHLQQTADGSLALLAYTALDRLFRCMGDHQRWVLVPAEELERLHAELRSDVVAIDAWVPPHLRPKK